jgi:hypothetical protein
VTNDPHLALEIIALVVTILIAIGGNVVGFMLGYVRFKAWAEAKSNEEKIRRENDAQTEALRWQQHLELDKQHWEAFEKRADERWTLLEQRTGVKNGDGYFVPARFCEQMHDKLQEEAVALRTEIHEATVKGDAAIREGREDRQKIRERLAAVESELHSLRAKLA